jgi:hypothetical protein
MADINQTPVLEQEPKKRNNRSVIYIILIIALVLLDGYWYFKNHTSQEQLNSQGQTINSDSSHIADLDSRYHEEMDSLYSYRGQNATLDSLLKIKINQLSGMEKSLATAQRQKKLDDTQYQKDITDLNSMSSDLKSQIADLQKQNGILISRNDSLGKNLEVSEGNNQQLTQENTTLGTKLTKASLLVPINIIGEGIKVTSSGKEKETANNKKAKKIKVAFDIPSNNTIDAGDKTFYLVLMDPKGAILSDQAQGSGTFTLAESTDQQQYTASKTVSFNQQKMHVDIEWNNIAGFDEGDYTAEIFQDGYLTGKSVIKLK